ncbi:TPA: fibronectin-binding protein FnbB [Staphylococcus aureus]|nr:fibronectin-binding protein FnbB [Staphylococcus aureus]
MKSNLRYGIRKHKLGAASVFLGTMIVVGMGQEKEAAASEENNTTVEESGSSATESKASETQTTTNNVNTIDETQSYSATSTEQPSQSTQVTTEEAPTTVQAPKVETSRVDLPSEKVADKETTGTQVDTAQPSNFSEIKPRVKRSADVAAVAEKEVVEEANATGTDVTSKVTVENGSKIVGHKQDTNVVNPHNAERVTLKYKWKFGEDIKPGDYFDFTLSNNVETHGISTLRKVPEIKSTTEDKVMAIGEVIDERKIRYTFTDYINSKKDLTAELNLNLFIDPTTVTKQGKQNVKVTLGNKEIEKEFNIKYLDGVKDRMGVTVNGRIDTLNKEKGKFIHFAYMKPNNQSLTSVTVTGQVTKGSKSGASNPTVKVYKHNGSDELAESVYAKLDDANKFEDVTNKVNLSYTGDGGYSLDFSDLDNSKDYVIKYEGEYDQNAKDLNFRTHLSGYHKNYPYYPNYYYPVQLTWDNGVAFYSNKAQGDGKDKPNDPIIEKSEPIDLDIKSEPPVEKHELTGTIEESNDSKPIDFEYHTAVEGAEGHAEGIVETEEDSIHVDYEESTHENSKHHADVVEYEEDTNPGGGQVTTESNLVEFDEDSTKGIVTGAVSDHTTVEDTKEYTTESNLIELVDELPEEHGQAQGPIEEITENNHHISHSGLGTENGHGNYGVIEEIEENSHVDIKSELGYEGGQNSGNQSFEEDTEEDKPKYEQGGNIVDIDFDSVPQIYGQNNGNQSFEEDTEKDKPKYEQGGNIIDIDFDSVPQIHGFNKHNEIIEEDTNKDKPNYQFGGHNSVDFEEDTTSPTPPTPEVPSEPETPTPPSPEVPSEPGTPTPPTPEVPAEPGKPVPPAKEEPKKPSKPVEQGKVVTPVIEINEKVKAVAPTKKAQSKKSELPETGGEESTNKGMLFGGLFSILGLALLRRNKKNHKA